MLALAVSAYGTPAPLRGPALSLSEGSVNTGVASFAAGAQGDGFSLVKGRGGLGLRKRRGTVKDRGGGYGAGYSWG